MVGHGGSSAGSYLADPTSPIPSHCASIVATSTLRVNTSNLMWYFARYLHFFLQCMECNTFNILSLAVSPNVFVRPCPNRNGMITTWCDCLINSGFMRSGYTGLWTLEIQDFNSNNWHCIEICCHSTIVHYEATDGQVVRAGVLVTRNVLSWSGGHEFESQSGRTWGCTVLLP